MGNQKEKLVGYCVTRNLYDHVLPSIKSLITHTHVDKVYLMIEDPVFPKTLPPIVECVDLSSQPWITKKSPNYGSRFTWMNMMRAMTPLIFPKHEKLLTLDADTIVMDDISDVLDLEMGERDYFSAVKEPEKTRDGFLYVNLGVTLWNLAAMRESGIMPKIISALESKEYNWVLQDCLNDLCRGHIAEMPPEYNVTRYTQTGRDQEKKIVHYAGDPFWYEKDVFLTYHGIPFSAIRPQ